MSKVTETVRVAMVAEYTQGKASVREVAKTWGISYSTAHKYLKEAGVLRTRLEAMTNHLKKKGYKE